MYKFEIFMKSENNLYAKMYIEYIKCLLTGNTIFFNEKIKGRYKRVHFFEFNNGLYYCVPEERLILEETILVNMSVVKAYRADCIRSERRDANKNI